MQFVYKIILNLLFLLGTYSYFTSFMQSFFEGIIKKRLTLRTDDITAL